MKSTVFVLICSIFLGLFGAVISPASATTKRPRFHVQPIKRTSMLRPQRKAIRVKSRVWQPKPGEFDGISASVDVTDHSAKIASDGIKFVGRYYGRPIGTKGHEYDTGNKILLSHREAVALSSRNVQLLSVWEMGGESITWYSRSQGVIDGQDAYFQAAKTGQPSGVIYFGFDMQIDPDDRYGHGINHSGTNPNLYMQGVREGLYNGYHDSQRQSDPHAPNPPSYTMGAYGGGVVCSSLKAQYIVNYTWEAVATSWPGYDSVNPPPVIDDKFHAPPYTQWDVHQFKRQGFDGLDVEPNIRRGNAGCFLVAGP